MPAVSSASIAFPPRSRATDRAAVLSRRGMAAGAGTMLASALSRQPRPNLLGPSAAPAAGEAHSVALGAVRSRGLAGGRIGARLPRKIFNHDAVLH